MLEIPKLREKWEKEFKNKKISTEEQTHNLNMIKEFNEKITLFQEQSKIIVKGSMFENVNLKNRLKELKKHCDLLEDRVEKYMSQQNLYQYLVEDLKTYKEASKLAMEKATYFHVLASGKEFSKDKLLSLPMINNQIIDIKTVLEEGIVGSYQLHEKIKLLSSEMENLKQINEGLLTENKSLKEKSNDLIIEQKPKFSFPEIEEYKTSLSNDLQTYSNYFDLLLTKYYTLYRIDEIVKSGNNVEMKAIPRPSEKINTHDALVLEEKLSEFEKKISSIRSSKKIDENKTDYKSIRMGNLIEYLKHPVKLKISSLAFSQSVNTNLAFVSTSSVKEKINLIAKINKALILERNGQINIIQKDQNRSSSKNYIVNKESLEKNARSLKISSYHLNIESKPTCYIKKMRRSIIREKKILYQNL